LREYIPKPRSFSALLWLLQLTPLGFLRFIFGSDLKTISDSALMEELVAGKSFVRWGDGETANLRGKSTWHQSGNQKLSQELLELINYSSNSEHVIFGVNFQAIRHSLLNRKKWQWAGFRILFSSRVLFNQWKFRKLMSSPLADALFWYNHSEQLVKKLEQIAPKNRRILLIGSNSEVMSILKNWNSVTFITIPPRDAFSDIQNIIERVDSWLTTLNHDKDGIIVLSGGSASKILVPKFSHVCQIIDVGSGLAFAFEGKKVMDWDK